MACLPQLTHCLGHRFVPESHKDMFDAQRYVSFLVCQVSRVLGVMFDESLLRESSLRRGFPGFFRRHMLKVCLIYLCNGKSFFPVSHASQAKGMFDVPL